MFTRDVSKVEILLNTDCPLALPININTSTATHRWWSCTVLYCTVQVVVLSPLNNFMVSSLHHNREERPSSLQWGLMGSVQV